MIGDTSFTFLRRSVRRLVLLVSKSYNFKLCYLWAMLIEMTSRAKFSMEEYNINHHNIALVKSFALSKDTSTVELSFALSKDPSCDGRSRCISRQNLRSTDQL